MAPTGSQGMSRSYGGLGFSSSVNPVLETGMRRPRLMEGFPIIAELARLVSGLSRSSCHFEVSMA